MSTVAFTLSQRRLIPTCKRLFQRVGDFLVHCLFFSLAAFNLTAQGLN